MSTDPRSHDQKQTTQTSTLEESIEQSEPDQLATNWKPTDTAENYCLRCDGDIPADVARVFGDNNGRVVCCANCTTNRNGQDFDTHSRVLQKALGGHL